MRYTHILRWVIPFLNGASTTWIGDLIDGEDEGSVILYIRALKVVLDLGFSNISFSSAVFKSIAVTGFYSSPKSFWSCIHVNSSQNYALYINLHILLNILCKETLYIQESRKLIKSLKR